MTTAAADAYFASRVRQSQLGAWASRQSEPLSGRRELIQRYLQEKARRLGRGVPRPHFWGGYRLAPERIEFWDDGTFRLHERLEYLHDGAAWSNRQLFP